MVELDKNILDLAKYIAMNSTGYKVYIGGGMPRDVMLGVTPKDIDLFFVPEEGMDEYMLCDKHPMLHFSYRMETNDTQSLYQRGVEQLIGFKTPLMSVKELQFIVYGASLTAQELAEDMDIGICQIMLDVLTGQWYVSDNFKKDVVNKEIRCYHKYDKWRMIERFERMEKKYPAFKSVGKPKMCVSDFIDEPIEALSHTFRKIKPRKVKCASGY